MLKTLHKPKRRALHIGPEDHGRHMSLDDFDKAIGREGSLYELNKGVIEVSDVPHPAHGLVMQAIRNQLTAYQLQHEGSIAYIGGGGDAKLLIGPAQSERHPDLSIYLSPPPDTKEVWSTWVPAIVVEIVSPSSSKRDYEEKPAEYFEFGVDEYWIVDPAKNKMAALYRWRGQWKEKTVKAPQKYATRHLPRFTLDLKRVMAAGKST